VTIAEALETLGVWVEHEGVVESDGPYIGVTTPTGDAMWLVVVPEAKMHEVERLLGTR
jgi:hypothetical protein